MATYIKGSAVANATNYELFEKTGPNDYTSLGENTELNFEVSALDLEAGEHTLVVVAKAEGYENSAYSNEVVYIASEGGSSGSGGDVDDGGDGGGTTPTKYTFTINPTPSNATVTLNGVAQKSITVDSGTSVAWEVSASGYTEKSGTYNVTSNYTMNVELVANSSGGGTTGGEIDLTSAFNSKFTAGAIYADSANANFGGTHSSQTAYYANGANTAYINISEYAGKTLKITLPYATQTGHIAYGICFYSATGKSNAVGGATMTYTDGSVGAEVREVVIPANAKLARTTWLTPENEAACGVAFSAKVIA